MTKKYKTFFLYIIPIVLLTLFSSCESSVFTACGQEHSLNEEYKIKFQLGDTLIFESESNKEYFYISLLESGEIYATQAGQSDVGCDAYYEFEMIGICPLSEKHCIDTLDKDLFMGRDCEICDNCMNICKKMSRRPIHRFNKELEDPVLSLSTDWSDVLSNRQEYQETLILNNHKYYDCYVFYDINDSINRIYYNHKLGFVGYKKSNSNIFNLRE